ncbi:zinc finger, C3HC4 type (RING finger) protein (macronuclear) [Tetrahymena thermophila SB210]|uniref:Zinc finger, C3HC4 type (RING finger) protein n=1 Tax=Tetrahymena thermophila (strain SB210) TaxID=312017 RepID=Q22NG2_TETTS|nr:zinc finger, C3HC4 type (RING finger) protein [Tetrahymena thermophila SB210]EAR86823.2 zinc finger, C3HC4 type (RING finger) protein [Tetrahymena thermophila SB210]|eukprot:XP_001007068.2 zinc finger, C3HC4 type (RING finger) protein [Tetrahymena thermophila SB210]
MLCSKIWSNTYTGSRQLKTKNNFETKGIFWVFTLLLSLCCTSCCTVIGISQFLDNHTLTWIFNSLYVSCSFLGFEIFVFFYLKNDLKQFIKNIFFDEEEQVQLDSRRQQRNNTNANFQYSTFNIQNQLPHINQIINNININFIHNYQFYSHQRQSYKQKTKLREVQVQGNLNFPQFVMKCSSTYFKFLNLKSKNQKIVPINQNLEQKFQDQVDIEQENKSQISQNQKENNQNQVQNERVITHQPIDSEDQINRKNYQDLPHFSNSTTDKRLSRDQYKKLLISKLFQNNSYQVCTIDDMPLNSAKADNEIKTSRNYDKTNVNLEIDYTHRQQLKKLFQKDKDCFNNKIFKKRNESKSSLNLECQITQENYEIQNKSLPYISNLVNVQSQQINELDSLNDQIRSAQIIRDIEQQFNKENNKIIKFLSQNNDFPVSPTFYDPKLESLNQNCENSKANNIINANTNLISNSNSNSNTKDNTNANTNTNSQIDIKSSTSQQIICLVCFDSECNSIFAPCGHGGLCYQCALDVFKKQGDCLLCRKKVTEIYKYIEVVEENSKKDQPHKYFQIQTITKYLDSNQNSMIKKQRLQNKNSFKNTVYTQGEIEQQIQQYSFCDFDDFGNQIISEQQVQNQSGNRNLGIQNSSSIQSNKEQSLSQQQQQSMQSSLNVISPLNSDRERQKNSNIKKYNDIIQNVASDNIQNRQLRSITQQSDSHARFISDQLQIQQELFVPQFLIDKDLQPNLILRQSPQLINYQKVNQEMATTQATDAFLNSQSQHQIVQNYNQKSQEQNILKQQHSSELNNVFKQKDNKSKNINIFSENLNFTSRQNAIISNQNYINHQKKTSEKSILKDCNFDNQTDFLQRQNSFSKQ